MPRVYTRARERVWLNKPDKPFAHKIRGMHTYVTSHPENTA